MILIPYDRKGRRGKCDKVSSILESPAREKSNCNLSIGQTTTVIHRQHSFSILFFTFLCQIGFNQIQFSRYNKINSDVWDVDDNRSGHKDHLIICEKNFLRRIFGLYIDQDTLRLKKYINWGPRLIHEIKVISEENDREQWRMIECYRSCGK